MIGHGKEASVQEFSDGLYFAKKIRFRNCIIFYSKFALVIYEIMVAYMFICVIVLCR